MNFPTQKIRQLWLPFLLLAVAILATSWFLAGVVYPSNIQGNDPGLLIAAQPTPTFTSSTSPTNTWTPTATRTVAADTPTATTKFICTHSINYWRLNPELWMIENLVIGNLSFTKGEALDILEIMEPDPTTQLMQHFFAAMLNTINDAGTDEIDLAIVRIGDWLILHPPGDNLTEVESQEVEALIRQLDNYNSGLTGPGQCAGEPSTPTPAYTATQTATSTFTPAPASTIIPPTPTPTKSNNGRPKPTQALPTSTPPPTNTPKPQPTNTPVPQPTNTPQPKPTTAIPPTQEG
jgi:hypothetical protein